MESDSSVDSAGLDVGSTHTTAVETVADELLDGLLADHYRAAVENYDEMLLACEGPEAVSLTTAMAETEIENEGAREGADIFKKFHICVSLG